MLETIHRIGGQVLRADRPDPLPEPGDRTRPPDPLGEHRRRHPGGYAVNRARMRGSTSLIADGGEARSYFGGPSLASALATVSRAMLSFRAIARCDNPSLR